MRALRRWFAVSLLVVAGAGFASKPDYDAFSDPEGHIRDEHVLAAQSMVQDSAQLQAVFDDAARGNKRAARVYLELEIRFFPDIGREVASQAHSLTCLTPVYRELSGRCIPSWSRLDFLPKTEAGARLRKAVADAYAARAKELGVENTAILSAVNALIAAGGAMVAAQAAETRAATTAALSPVATAPAAEGRVIALGLSEHLDA